MAYITFQPSDYFNTKLYTGNGSTQSITGVGFQPDWVWSKKRNATCDHHIFDVIRGATYKINSASTETSSADANTLTSFDSDGFSVGTNSCQNNSSDTFVSWNWRAGNSQGSSNTDGSINTTYTSVNTTAGFSISTYTGNSTQGATLGHGLGVAPSMIILKSTTHTEDWAVAHEHMNSTNPWDYYMNLNATSAKGQNNNRFGNVSPTNTVFTLGSSDEVNGSGKSYVAYCFAEKKGFSHFSSHVGNGDTNGPYIYTGFKPAWFLLKPSSIAGSWFVWDSTRSPINQAQKILSLYANDTSDETAGSEIDFLSNGVKVRSNSGTYNHSAIEYIYMAFAEEPFVASNKDPATAR